VACKTSFHWPETSSAVFPTWLEDCASSLMVADISLMEAAWKAIVRSCSSMEVEI